MLLGVGSGAAGTTGVAVALVVVAVVAVQARLFGLAVVVAAEATAALLRPAFVFLSRRLDVLVLRVVVFEAVAAAVVVLVVVVVVVVLEVVALSSKNLASWKGTSSTGCLRSAIRNSLSAPAGKELC